MAALQKVRDNLTKLKTSARSEWGDQVTELDEGRQRLPGDHLRDQRRQPPLRPAHDRRDLERIDTA